ncbi:MAG: TIGR03086 family protein [Frankiales bacterium]|nr:TIGR03086 family protein [Frankiales bacterium]
MSELVDRFERAHRHFGSLVHRVPADRWGAPTPCADWDVRALVNHLVYEARWAVPLLEGATIADVGDRFDGDLLGDDPVGSYDDALAAASAAVSSPGALDRTVHLSYGETPATGYLAQLTGDFVVHAWDLARGIGADDELDADLVAWVDAETRPNAEMLAQSGLFDPPVDVAPDADPQTRMLALFGRRRTVAT